MWRYLSKDRIQSANNLMIYKFVKKSSTFELFFRALKFQPEKVERILLSIAISKQNIKLTVELHQITK